MINLFLPWPNNIQTSSFFCSLSRWFNNFLYNIWKKFKTLVIRVDWFESDMYCNNFGDRFSYDRSHVVINVSVYIAIGDRSKHCIHCFGLVKIRCSQNFLECYKVIALIRKEPRLLY